MLMICQSISPSYMICYEGSSMEVTSPCLICQSVSPRQPRHLQIITPRCHTNHTNVCQISHTHTRPLTSRPSQSRRRTSRSQPIGARHGGHVTRILQRWIWFWQTLIWFVWQIWVINILHCTNLTWKHFYIWSLMKYEPTCISPKPLLL